MTQFGVFVARKAMSFSEKELRAKANAMRANGAKVHQIAKTLGVRPDDVFRMLHSTKNKGI